MVAALKTFTGGGHPSAGSVTKHAWSKIKVAVDWTQVGSAISQSTWVAPASSTVVFNGAAVLGNVSSVDISVGRPGEIAIAENRIVFGDGTADVFMLMTVID